MKNDSTPPAPPTPTKGSPYSRFIPREELSSFTAWDPGTVTSSASGTAPPAPRSGLRRASDHDPQGGDAAGDDETQVRAARQSGYQDGYRDGLAALEGFKQSFASQITAQVGVLMGTLGQQLDTLEKDMAHCLAESATRLARQIVRSEITHRPELVQQVAREATEALLRSASQITLRVHPDDQPLIAEGAGDVLTARGARLIADKAISRGGCLVESDIGNVDATIEMRWRQGIAPLGAESDWDLPESQVADAVADAGTGADAAVVADGESPVRRGADTPRAMPSQAASAEPPPADVQDSLDMDDRVDTQGEHAATPSGSRAAERDSA